MQLPAIWTRPPVLAPVMVAALAIVACLGAWFSMPAKAYADEFTLGTASPASSVEENAYDIVFKLNGGTQSNNQVTTIRQGATLKVSSLAKPTRVGYKFVGWYKNKKLTKRATSLRGVAAKGKRTVYAKWKFSAYRIVYKLNGGKLSVSYKKTIKKNKTYKVSKLKKPTRKGYLFKGWYSNKSLTKKAKKIFGKPSVSKRTVYAKWKSRSYSITYDANGGTMPGSYAKTYKTSKGLSSLPVPTLPGYAFMGWYSDAALTKIVPSLAKGAYGNKRLYAKWRERVLVAHKGYHVTEPENSLASYREAAKRGFTRVETDIRFTADDVAVLSHNDDITLVSVVEKEVEVEVPILDDDGNETGETEKVSKTVEEEILTPTAISEITLEDLQNSTIANKKPSGDDGRNYTTFEELIAFCRDAELMPNIELKSGTNSQIRSLVALVDEYGMKDRVVWSSFQKLLLYEVFAVHSDVAFQVLDDDVSNRTSKMNVANNLRSKGGDAVICISKDMPSSSRSNYLKACKEKGMPLGIWTFDNELPISKYNYFYSVFSVDGLVGDTVPDIV